MTDNSKTNRAEAQFKKMQRAEDGKKAMSEYEADAVAVRARTAKLRELRLARDAAEAAAAPVVVPKKPAKKAAKKATRAAPALADYLKDREDNGRDN